MSERPELFELFLADELDGDRVTASVLAVIEPLVDAGFDVELAYDAWETVSTIALGAAASSIRWYAERARGESRRLRLQHALLRRASMSGEALLELGAAASREPDASFERRLDLVLGELRRRVDAARSE